MNKKEILAYVYDFASFLLERTENVTDIILFGSVARDEFDYSSDVDIFINTTTAEKTEKEANIALEAFERISAKKWMLKGIKLPIKMIVGNLSEPRWTALHRDIVSSGIAIFGKYKELPKGLSHMTILSFQLSNLKPKERVAIIRKVYGYTTKKQHKTYVHKGLLETTKGIKLNPNTIAVPIEHHQTMLALLRKSKVPLKIREVWM